MSRSIHREQHTARANRLTFTAHVFTVTLQPNHQWWKVSKTEPVLLTCDWYCILMLDFQESVGPLIVLYSDDTWCSDQQIFYKKTLNQISVSFQYGWRCVQMSYWDIWRQSRWAVILFTDCAEESVLFLKHATSTFIPSSCFVWLQMFKLRFGQLCHFEEGGYVFELLFLSAAGRGHQRCKCSFM